MEWPTVKLGDVCKIEKEQFREGNLPYVGLEDIEGFTGRFLGGLDPRAVASSTFKFSSSHVLYGRLRPYLNKVLVPNFEGHCSSEIFPLKPTSQLNRSYLYYWLSSDRIVSAINETCTGARMPRANVNTILTFEIPLPPLPEQKRLVAILDEVFADIEQVRAKTEQNLKNARELFESYLQQVFSQRGEGWVEKALGDVCKFENGDRGKNYPSRSKFVESGFAFINAGHIDDGTVDFNKMNYITEENYSLLSRGKVKQGDILFCLRGSLGKFAVIEDDIQGAIASSLVIIRPHSDLSISFLLHYLRSGLCKSMIEKYAGGAAQPNLGAKDLAKFSISVPPAAQQLQTSDKLDSLMAAVENLESIYSDKLAALDELKKSILQKAFSGELTKKTSLEVAHD